MSLLDLHEDELISASEAAPAVAPRKQDPSFSTWGAVTGVVKAVPAGVAEMTASGIDLLSGLSKVDVSAKAMADSQTDEGRKRVQKKAQETLETGFRSDPGRSLRNVAKDYMPDPQTAHGAEVAVAEFARMATKAVGAGIVLGPVAGALVAGAEEGFTASDKLAEQGVDVNTRTQVGALTGAVTGLGFALPVAGKTWAQTVGLALAGGPASFMAQNAGTREILQRAEYGKLADQYDPFDPVGLTLSTLVPLGFGAVAMRGAAKRAAAGKPVPEAAPVAPEVVDAARVQLLRENVDAHRATPPEDFAAAQAHDAAVAQALDQMATGQRVDVAQSLETPRPKLAEPQQEYKTTYADAQGEQYTIGLKQEVLGMGSDRSLSVIVEARTADGNRRAVVNFEVDGNTLAAGNVNTASAYQRRGIAEAMYRAARDAGYEIVPGRTQTADGAKLVQRLIDKGLMDVPATTKITQAMADRMAPVAREIEALRPPETVQVAPAAAMEAPAQPARFDIDAIAREASDFLSDGRSPAEILGRMEAEGRAAPPELQNMIVGLSEFGRRMPELLDQFRALEARNTDAPAQNLIADAVERMRAGQPVDAGPAPASPLQARLDAEIVGNPAAMDTRLPIAFDDAGKVTETMTAREYLDAVAAEAAQESADANLLQVAANCFLTSGA